MSLGYAKDSIADLQKLYNSHKDEDDKFYTTPPASRDSNNLTLSSGENGNGNGDGDSDNDDFLFYDDYDSNDNGNDNSNVNAENNGDGPTNTNISGDANTAANTTKLPTPATTAVTTTDDSNKMKRSPSTFIVMDEPLHIPEAKDWTSPWTTTTATTATTATTTTATEKVPTPISTSEPTPTPTSDFINNKAKNTMPSPKKKNIFSNSTTTSTADLSTPLKDNNKNAVPNYYSGFDYTSYDSDYTFNAYVDPYGVNNYDKGITSFTSDQQSANKNIFCCFFPEKSISCTDDDDSSSSSDVLSSSSDDSSVDMEKDDDSDLSLGTSHHGLDIGLSLAGSTSFESVCITDDNECNIASKTNSLSQSNNAPSDNGPSLKENVSQDVQLSKNAPPQIVETMPANQTKANVNEHEKESYETRTTANTAETTTAAAAATAATAATTAANSMPTTTPVRKSTPSTSKHKVPLKGILKHTVTKPESNSRSVVSSSSAGQKMSGLNNNNSDTKNNESNRRRSILPSYEISSPSKDENDTDNNQAGDDTKQERNKHRVSFSPMARVVNVTARSEMSFFSRSLIWWQRNDYDDFKKTGRIIAKAMLCGGSEIWLQTSNAWGKKQGHSNVATNIQGGNNNDKAVQHMESLKKYGVTDNDINNEEKDEDMGSKWWCKFGHSRRGLEHIVSIEEGRQRQRFVNIAIQAVLDEQRRQRVTRKDPNKIAAVSMQYTSWARDLATAAGTADAEAVKSNFDSKAKCRIHHLRRSLNGKSSSVIGGRGGAAGGIGNGSGGLHIPSATFILSANSALTAKVLDANAHSSFRVKRIGQHNNIDEEKHSSPVNVIAKKAAGFQFQTPTQGEQ